MRTGVKLAIGVVAMVCASVVARADAPGAQAAIEVGLTPQALAVCGVTATQASAVLAAVNQATEAAAALASAKSAAEQARTAYGEAAQQSRADPTNTELRALRATRRTEMKTAYVLIESKKVALRQVGVQGLSTQVQTIIEQFIARAGLRMPDQYRLATGSEIDWSDVELAVTARTRADRLGISLDSTQASLLAAIEADSQVVAAAQSLANLQAIKLVFQPE